ncbi:arylsulfatase [Nocardioides daejeonensis]|uniref:arylsulfatase n=1 Tax=Nocardioides daejeonensis TaxID=1046556 RepID=UPI000D74B469|nr:arylsulfatase [Nocardioides daejeonensis]
MPEPTPAFAGKITDAMSQSKPWWPPRVSSPAGAPNVVVMIVDDLGYSDIGPFGSEIPTPHLDAVAGEGVRLANFHVTPTCSPTRAALLTGRNAHAVGIGGVCNVDPGYPGYAAELPPNQPTIAETLRDQGYSTLMVGKWHLCKERDLGVGGSKHSWPLQRGFDQFYGFLEAQTNFFHPHQLYEGNNPVDVDQYPEGYYLTDDLTERALRMITDAVTDQPAKPFFLYYAHGAVHTPLHAKPEDIAEFAGQYDRGWDEVRAERFARQKEMGLVPGDAVLPPLSDAPDKPVLPWAEMPEGGQRLAARYQEVFAAMVGTIDESVGRIRGVLDRLGVLDNTVFVFLSDNGAASDGGTHIGNPQHMSSLNGNARRPMEERIPEELPLLELIGGPRTWPANPVGWATTSNTPFRRHKFSSFRGGNQVACLVSWPRGLGEVGGQIRHEYTHVTDIMPTLLELAGVPTATERQGLAADPLDGVSCAPHLRDGSLPTAHTEQYLECFGERAYYRDGWEAVAIRKPLTPFRDDRWELYDTATDVNQMRDLAELHPDLVAELTAAWDEAADQNQVLPMVDGTPVHWFSRNPVDEQLSTRPQLFLPENGTVERYRSSHLIDGRSFQIHADLAGYRPGDEGVLVAHGGQEAGYLLYVEEGHVVFAENAFGPMVSTTPAPVPVGARRISVAVTAPGKARWLVEVLIDGAVVATSEEFVQLTWLVPFNGLNIGRDRRSPVHWELAQRKGTFPWTGVLQSVTYEPGEHAPDAFATMVDQFREMGRATQ